MSTLYCGLINTKFLSHCFKNFVVSVNFLYFFLLQKYDYDLMYNRNVFIIWSLSEFLLLSGYHSWFWKGQVTRKRSYLEHLNMFKKLKTTLVKSLTINTKSICSSEHYCVALFILRIYSLLIKWETEHETKKGTLVL